MRGFSAVGKKSNRDDYKNYYKNYCKYTTKSITAIPEPDERLKEWETCRWDIPVKSPQLITAPAPRSISSIAGIDHL
jgi:hypothetical protein